MSNSLRCKIKKLNHKGLLSDKDMDRLISALDTADSKDERYALAREEIKHEQDLLSKAEEDIETFEKISDDFAGRYGDDCQYCAKIKEIIKYLKYREEFRTTLNKAIGGLKPKTSDGDLDKDTVLNVIDCYLGGHLQEKSISNIISLVKEEVDKAEEKQNIDTGQEWVSVKDRLPTKAEYNACNGLFIVTDGDRSYSAYFAVSKQVFGEPTMEGFRVDRNVIAWMPLPKPLSDIDNGSTTEFEESRYRSVDQTGETFDAGEAWRCEKCCHSWKKDWTLRFKFCPACGRRIIKFKS
jgi:hypothetical protein